MGYAKDMEADDKEEDSDATSRRHNRRHKLTLAGYALASSASAIILGVKGFVSQIPTRSSVAFDDE